MADRDRRRLLAASAAAALLAGGAAPPTARAVDVVEEGADPTGASDSAGAFRRAFARLPANGGAIHAPAGRYRLDSDPEWGGKTVRFSGDGIGNTILVINHAGIGLSIRQTDLMQRMTVRELSFEAAFGAASACALSLSCRTGIVSDAFQNALVRDVEIISTWQAGLPAPYPRSFLVGLDLAGIYAGRFENIRMLGPDEPRPVEGSRFVRLRTSVGVVFDDCQCYGAEIAWEVTDYSEGISLLNARLVGCGTGLALDPASAPRTSSAIGAYRGLSLYVFGGEFDVMRAGLRLDGLDNAWIHGTRFAARDDDDGVVLIDAVDCSALTVHQCVFEGRDAFGRATGLRLGQARGMSYGGTISGNSFSLLGTPVLLEKGVFGNTVVFNQASRAAGVAHPEGFIDRDGRNLVAWAGEDGALVLGSRLHLAGGTAEIASLGQALALTGRGAGVVVADGLKVSGTVQMLTARRLADLPPASSVAWSLAVCADACKPGEPAGRGSGMIVQSDGTRWSDLAGHAVRV